MRIVIKRLRPNQSPLLSHRWVVVLLNLRTSDMQIDSYRPSQAACIERADELIKGGQNGVRKL